MTRTVMLTGGTGYLGSAVLRELCAHGYQVRALVRDPGRLRVPDEARVTPVPGDLLDPPSLAAALEGTEAVIHVAGLSSDWAPDPAVYERVNVDGTRNVLEAARAAGVRRVVATSSVMVLGPTDDLLTGSETTTRPSRAFFLPYQVTKALAFDLCREARSRGLDLTVLLCGALFGPGPLTEGNYLARLMGLLERGACPALPRDRGQRWCLAHVEDVARGHRLALERARPGRDYILGGENVPLERVLHTVSDGLALPGLPPRVPGWLLLTGLRLLAARHALFGTRPPIGYGTGRVLLHSWAFSSRRAALQLGYTWRRFDEAFPEFVRWYAAGAGQLRPEHRAGPLGVS